MGAITRLSIDLPDDMASAVREQVASGQYASESEVIQEGLRALKARDEIEGDWLRAEIADAYEAWRANPTDVLTVDQVRQKLEEARRAHG